jgi:hypothetical protein
MMPILFAAMFCGCDPDGSCEAYLYQPAYCLDFELRGPVRPYSPQPGDVLLATDGKIFWKITHNLAGTGHPHHTGVVFQRPDGSMAVLEAGPHDTVRINNLDWYPHMVEYEQKGRIWIRQRKCPLTPEQSACLTEFCLAQEGKFFALGRLGKQVTLFRSRGPLRTAFMGQPHGIDRRSYYCSELALEALVYAGTLDPETTRPAATYPRDIFFDDSPNPYLKRHLDMSPCWYAPARFTTCPNQCGSGCGCDTNSAAAAATVAPPAASK